MANIYNEEEQQKKKLSFSEWYKENFIANRVHGMLRTDKITVEEACWMAWNAGQENK